MHRRVLFTKIGVLSMTVILFLMAVLGSVYTILLLLGLASLASIVDSFASLLVLIIQYGVYGLILYTIASNSHTRDTRRKANEMWKGKLGQIVSQTQALMRITKQVKPSVAPKSAMVGYAGFNRIVVGEKLLRDMDDQELSGVIGHELSHGIRHHGLYKSFMFGAVFAFVILGEFIPSLSITRVIVVTALAIASFAEIPFSWRLEYAADRTAAEYLGVPIMTRTLRKLQTMIYDGFSFTHPSLSNRIKRLEGAEHDIQCGFDNFPSPSPASARVGSGVEPIF